MSLKPSSLNMTLSTILPLFALPLVFISTNAATFVITNRCRYTAWAAAIPGGGKQLDLGQSWTITVNPGTNGGRIWPRTGCNFDASGRGRCQTGDCSGLLECTTYGQPPNTLAEFAIKQFSDLDYFDISLVDGFNVPMDFRPISDGCTIGARCTADINSQCPNELRVPGGCNNPCTIFQNDQYCCTSGSCGPTDYSKFFEDRCPDAFSYPMDDNNSIFGCPSGANYSIIFCPFILST
ncbi:hypothetical protein AAC387_Pa06g1644 [Persea americana]